MESYPENLKRLADLFKAAKTLAEREILLQGVRIVSGNDYEVLEVIIIRDQVREMPLPTVINLIADQRDIPTQRAEEMVRELIQDHLLDRAKLRLHTGVTPEREGAQDEATSAPSVSPVVATDQVKMPDHSVVPLGNEPQRPRPAVVIPKETEEPHQYPPSDLEPRDQQAKPAESEAGQSADQSNGSPLMPKGVG